MKIGALDEPTIQYRRNIHTGEVEFRYVWETDELGGFFASAWSAVKGFGTKAISKVASIGKAGISRLKTEISTAFNKPPGALMEQAAKIYNQNRNQSFPPAVGPAPSYAGGTQPYPPSYPPQSATTGQVSFNPPSFLQYQRPVQVRSMPPYQVPPSNMMLPIVIGGGVLLVAVAFMARRR